MTTGIKMDNINELKIWLEGEFKLIRVGSENTGKQVLDLITKVAAHDTEISNLKTKNVEEKAVLSTIKAAWGVGGAIIGGALALGLEIAKVIHP